MTILHITSTSQWDPGAAHHHDPSIDAEGFIHCSTPEQVLLPANAIYRGRTDLVLLVIDPSALDAPLVYEDCYESGMEFPHVYGPIATAAVRQVVDFPPLPDGTFELPEALETT